MDKIKIYGSGKIKAGPIEVSFVGEEPDEESGTEPGSEAECSKTIDSKAFDDIMKEIKELKARLDALYERVILLRQKRRE